MTIVEIMYIMLQFARLFCEWKIRKLELMNKCYAQIRLCFTSLAICCYAYEDDTYGKNDMVFFTSARNIQN
jgi:hypothetical protein